ncbi:grpE protein homolog 2, mitochondrial-like [Salvia miltiorrhiza]|uniref:grpE protein homolog 2, mitochondrial-like n=1 Tax=Salvia miltiorrhiza TaxID=226208 RepID=UPI0025AC8ABB|nr:grpE protein homolog 2, mitochondrial-like [Salvia miltiorrhiza]
MSATKITHLFARTLLAKSPLIFGRRHIASLTNQPPSSALFHDKVLIGQWGLRHHSAPCLSSFQWFGISSAASLQPNTKENPQSGNEHVNKANNQAASAVESPHKTEPSASKVKTESVSATEPKSNASGTNRRRGVTKRTAFSDSESESDSDLEDLSRDDLLKLVVEKEQLLGVKQKELEQMKDKVLRTLAEMENVKERTTRESENTKKFAIQNFAKSLLDVADNLGRASSAAKESFSKINVHEDAVGAFQQLKVLLQGVEMTEKQLLEVFRKFGLERYDPVNEDFDPNRHNAVFQVPDSSKPADRVAVVLKAGYMLHDRVIRPAEVGVTVAANN